MIVSIPNSTAAAAAALSILTLTVPYLACHRFLGWRRHVTEGAQRHQMMSWLVRYRRQEAGKQALLLSLHFYLLFFLFPALCPLTACRGLYSQNAREREPPFRVGKPTSLAVGPFPLERLSYGNCATSVRVYVRTYARTCYHQSSVQGRGPLEFSRVGNRTCFFPT
jgi:hypothetical protein